MYWLESLLYLWLFKNWGTFYKRSTLFYSLAVLLIAVWIYDNLVRNNLTTTNSLFRIVLSFLLIFLSIEQINKLIAECQEKIFYSIRFFNYVVV
jgi:hypothetical protein